MLKTVYPLYYGLQFNVRLANLTTGLVGHSRSTRQPFFISLINYISETKRPILGDWALLNAGRAGYGD